MGADGFVTSNLVSPSYAPNMVIEPTHLDINIDADIPHYTINAVVKQTFGYLKESKGHALDDTLYRKIILNAVGFLNLQVSPESDTPTEKLTHVYDGKEITLVWDTPFQPMESRTVVFTYTITKPISGLYFNVPNAAYPNRAAHVITDHETERARYWLPCVDFPASRTTLKFTLTGPASYTAVANGKLVSETPLSSNEEKKTTVYQLDVPCPSYLICFAMGDFVSVDDTPVRNIPIRYIAPKGYKKVDLVRTFGRTPAMIQWIEKKLDFSFPWPKYFQIVSKFIGGAMENISLVTWLDRYVQDDVYAKEMSLLVDMTNIHEMAHTYFGDLIVIRHFEHVWLKESWATYFEALWLEDNVSQDEFRYEMYGNAIRYMAETGSYVRPMVTRTYDISWKMFDMHTYPGGGCRLHMLRKVVGDAAFFRGVQNYVKRYARKTAETDQFRTCIEEPSGMNLTPFFDQWFYSCGYPKLKASWDYKPEKKVAVLVFEQTQVDESKQIGLFDMILPLEITDEDGHVFTEQVVLTRHSKKSVVAVSLGSAKPKIVRVDPEGHWLFSLEMNPGEAILGQTAVEAKDLVSRIRAYQELIKLGTFSAIQKVREGILKEPFYGVRVQVAKALAKAKTNAALRVLADVLVAEKDPQAGFGIAGVCNIRDDVLGQALFNFVKRTDVCYRARGSALANLGLQRQKEYTDYLLQLAKDDTQIGMHGWVRSGVLSGLGASRDPDALEYLVSRTPPGLEPEECRASVYRAISSSATWQEKRVLKTCIELLEKGLVSDLDLEGDGASSTRAVSFACLRGLVSLESTSSVGVISSTRVCFDEREDQIVKELLRKLSTSGGGPTGGLAEKWKSALALIEELETRVRKLEDKELTREANNKVSGSDDNGDKKQGEEEKA